jgi:hypothetical protein
VIYVLGIIKLFDVAQTPWRTRTEPRWPWGTALGGGYLGAYARPWLAARNQSQGFWGAGAMAQGRFSMNESPRVKESTATAREPEPKAHEPEHLYDAPGITALQFIDAVMHDPRTPLHVRVDAANKLLYLVPAHIPANMHRAYIWGELAGLVYRIEGFSLQ